MILSIIFIVLAAICKAMSDTIAFHKGGKFKSSFFNINKQGKFLPLTKWPFDGFHVFNSLMIIFFILAVFGFTWEAVVVGVAFNLVFNLFFNKIFKK